jgi:hypothetical protein
MSNKAECFVEGYVTALIFSTVIGFAAHFLDLGLFSVA